jgi:hypothetical protein
MHSTAPLNAAARVHGLRVGRPARALREEVRRDLGDTGGSSKAEAEYRIASGRP